MKHYKSPADYVLGTVRQMGLGDAILAMRPKDANPTTPIKQEIIDQLGYIQHHMFKMGLDLCYPNDVNGWKWGEEWVSTSMMTYRMQYHGMMIWKMSKRENAFYYLSSNQMTWTTGKLSRKGRRLQLGKS
jgi:hypothetical protein